MNKAKNLQNYRRTKKGVLTNLYGKIKQRNKEKFNLELDFTLKEFQQKYIDDSIFNEIYQNWLNNGFQYYDKPSVDRINPDLPYKFENMQILSWRDNRRKGEKERARISTSVAMYTIEGEHIRDFDSVKSAVSETGLRESGIVSCCTGRYKTTGGYVFKYISSKYKKTKRFIEKQKNIHDDSELL